MLLPKEIVENYIENSQNKIKTPTKTMILLGLMAGMFIACGASASNVAMHSIDNIALSRFIGGCVFPIGLMMIIFSCINGYCFKKRIRKNPCSILSYICICSKWL
ncbi:formate/nitrite transporter family protein [Clostridium sp. HCP1S3_B4]|uniref:formate/nitrite transporter family protein n=1 Tax=unclassified Clostridium TaxID=2614128 RepID=UPI002A77A447|nr:formate/nitrite transporter family protein [Clostridiales bacterium]MDY2730577.1 formate/nitrite transporter family protein [Clostridium sp.]